MVDMATRIEVAGAGAGGGLFNATFGGEKKKFH